MFSWTLTIDERLSCKRDISNEWQRHFEKALWLDTYPRRYLLLVHCFSRLYSLRQINTATCRPQRVRVQQQIPHPTDLLCNAQSHCMHAVQYGRLNIGWSIHQIAKFNIIRLYGIIIQLSVGASGRSPKAIQPQLKKFHFSVKFKPLQCKFMNGMLYTQPQKCMT